ncbi:MAG: hypothetical protein NXI19_04825 [Alphaproteobacteria bacterium]|nr:hypothetical protein [Alphaproteobacteria bacterium]
MSDTGFENLKHEARAILAGIQEIDGNQPVDRPELERRIVDLCTRATSLPAAEAKQLAEDLKALVEALDQTTQRIDQARQATESGNRALVGRRAAAAYGSAIDRRKRGL